MAVRRSSSVSEPLSPSALPDLAVLPRPLAADKLPVGQLVSKSSKLNPAGLEDKHYDDGGCRWYKDVILLSNSTGVINESLGGTHLVQKELDADTSVGTIEAEEMIVRLLKNPESALKTILAEQDTATWIKEQAGQSVVGFVTAIREVVNASYKRARLFDIGNGNYEVIREVGGEGKDGKRRDSGLDVQTGSKRDVVGVIVRQVVVEGNEIKLGNEIGTEFWN
ncbi:hypothetical protein BU24DRAFT_16991 [Aaosphaeria arxii CBS 175.79]|uniref:Uncharacterized protein n=1 Tax=Aaosphaeria arxii CBS 175.79 TaxID=1450172 RepID=A0A6A5Y6L8_9PLEO|nr:uncharacterized protein BU24DRAFT_16991 [Aaosphaeria arxii CBS 175.79]KAF2021205.1 hypothetical protein BU24DRAFT_16991 [Aaosphaeria arxii CBS 175.79]